MTLSEYFWRKVQEDKQAAEAAACRIRSWQQGKGSVQPFDYEAAVSRERQRSEHEMLLAHAEELEALEARVKAGEQ